MILKDDKAHLLQFTIESVKDAVFWITRDGSIHHANKSACKRLGYTYEEITNLSILDVNRQFDQIKIEQVFDLIKESGTKVIESTHYTKSGKAIPVEISTNYITHQGMEFTCSIVRDITERKRKESALRGALLEIRALKEQLEQEKNYLLEEIKLAHNYEEIISQSSNFRKVLQQVEQVANTGSTVLVTGETGTGKELIARAIHRLSKRSQRALIKVNCAALPANLIESELFGHEKGAFTGAVHQKIGRFELAHKGSLFLDEIGEMPIELQAKLLRAIQEGEIERLGGKEIIKVDVRLIAATNRNLEKEVQKGNFRSDLFYRVNVFPIHLPPLRERKDDVPLLISHFCKKHGARIGKQITNIPKKVIDKLQAYPFPGNIRELENIIERALIVSKDGTLSIDHLPIPEELQQAQTEEAAGFQELNTVQRNYIIKVLKHTKWQVSGKGGAAEILNLPPTTLQSRMKKLGISRSTDASLK